MPGLLAGKVTIVTGAASGIGRAAAIRFAGEGSRLVITDVNTTGLAETHEMIAAVGGEVLSHPADLLSVAAIEGVVAACDERFGALHIVANVAGTVTGGPLETYTEEVWDRVHAVNAKAPFFVARSAAPLMKRSGAGAIVIVSSMSGALGMDSQSVYCSSKGAAIALTRALAFDLSPHDIRVNCVCPGAVDTPMPRSFLANFPEEEQEPLKQGWVARQLMKRFGEPDEIANAVLFLASDEASFITGLIMPVDGGYASW
jgi:NAD(P)-dependent dehydrogenase (short-subunit alcohol dehydrogenase family)